MNLQSSVASMLENGAGLAISVSGGKDSDAMTYLLCDLWRREGYTGDLQLIHADLGRAEHWQTAQHIQDLSQRVGIPLTVVQHTKYDLLDGIRHRMVTRPDVPPFPSAKNRQCTSDWKRGPISKWLRNHYPTGDVICAMGLRADESPARAKKNPLELRPDCCSSVRTVYNWLPIHDYSVEQVWSSIGDNPRHPMYLKGNERLSCCFCILGSLNDLWNGIENDPELYLEYCKIEVESGFSFRHNFWLGKLRPELLTYAMQEWYADK